MPAPIITPIAPQIITVNAAYRLVVPISNITSADTVRIRGLLDFLQYTFDFSLNAAVITGTPTRKGSGEWHLTAVNPDGMAIAEIVYDVVDNIPVITDIGRLRIARGIETRLVIPVTGQVGQGSVRGPIIGLGEDIVNNEIVLTGIVPEDANFDLGGMGSLVANVSNTGGADSHTFPFDLVQPLAMPANFRISSTRAGIVTAQWNAVAGAASYQVRQGMLGLWQATTATSFQFPTVYEAGAYSFYARALDAYGLAGHIAGPVSHTVVRVVPPGAVASFNVTVSGTTITVSWTPPTNTGGGDITGYRIIGSLPTITPSASERSRTFRDLDDGTYFFAIEAGNSAGYGTRSEQRSASVFTTAPDAPRLSGFLSGTSARLSWNTPDDNGRTIQYYEISIAFGSWFSVGNTNSNTRSLSVGTTSFRVRAVNEKGASPASNSVSVTRATVPSTPRASISISGNRLSASWGSNGDGGSRITSFSVVITGPSGTVFSLSSTLTTSTSFSISQSGGYLLSVVASNSIGSSSIGTARATANLVIPASWTGYPNPWTVSISANVPAGTNILSNVLAFGTAPISYSRTASAVTRWTDSPNPNTILTSSSISHLQGGTWRVGTITASNSGGSSTLTIQIRVT